MICISSLKSSGGTPQFAPRSIAAERLEQAAPRRVAHELARVAHSDVFLYVVQVAALALVYGVAAQLSLRLALVHGQVTPIWPPTGIAVVALFLLGRRFWPAIAIGAFLVNAPISSSLLVAACIAAGNTLAPLVAVFVLERMGFRPELDRLRDAVALVAAALGSTLVSATAAR